MWPVQHLHPSPKEASVRSCSFLPINMVLKTNARLQEIGSRKESWRQLELEKSESGLLQDLLLVLLHMIMSWWLHIF